MAFAATLCVASALFVSGMVGLALINFGYAVDSAMDSVRFVVFFQPETTRQEAQSACNRIRALSSRGCRPIRESRSGVGEKHGGRPRVGEAPPAQPLSR